jgi:hypothetical protein
MPRLQPGLITVDDSGFGKAVRKLVTLPGDMTEFNLHVHSPVYSHRAFRCVGN